MSMFEFRPRLADGPPAPAAQASTGTAAAPAAVRTPAAPPAAPLAARRARRRRHIEALTGYAYAALSIGSVLLLWYLATLYKVEWYIRFNNIPTPGEVLDKVLEVNRSSSFLLNIGMSVRRILLGFCLATLGGVALGLAIGRYRLCRALCMPALEVFRPIPAIAWVPMAIMLWPSNEVSIVFITFLGAFFPILLNTIHGVDAIDEVLLRAARSLGAREGALMMQVVLPGALPHIFTGLAVGMGVAWVSLIAAEMISGQYGIGYFTWEAYSLISYPEIALGMLTIGVLGLLCSAAIRTGATLCMPWNRQHGGPAK